MELLPAVTVPELPEDPALVCVYLASLNLFETASFSNEDLQRTRQYQEETARTDFQQTFTSIDNYLRSLEMVSAARALDDFSVPPGSAAYPALEPIQSAHNSLLGG